ncbi:MAG: extracellular solute-binding protein, partial [Candidatus Humimicrobiaceae bacterium]
IIMKKSLLWITILIICISVVAVFSLAGCKKTEVAATTAAAETTTAAAETTAAEPIKLTWWSYQFQYEAYYKWIKDELIPAFEAIHPNVTIETVHIPYDNYQAKYLAAFTSRENVPDIFTGITPYYAGGLKICDPAKGEVKDYIMENLIPIVLPGSMWDGEIYGVPYEADLGMMYIYNRHMYEAAGLDPNKPPKTLDEALEHWKKLTKPDGSQYGYAIRYSGNPGGIMDKFQPFLHAFGGRYFSPDGKVASGYVNSPETVAALQFYGDLVNKYKVASLEVGAPRDAFGQGLSASLFRESFMIEFLKSQYDMIGDEDYSMAPLPNGVKNPGWTTAGHVNMVYKFAPDVNKKAAWEFLMFLLEPDNDWVRSSEKVGSMPLNKSLWETKKDILEARPDYTASVEILQGESNFYDFNSPAIVELAFPVGDAIVNVLFKNVDPKEELDKAAKKMDDILNKFWAPVK